MYQSRRPKIGSYVEVRARGTQFRGYISAVSDTEIHLKSETKTWTIPFDSIQSMKTVPEPRRPSLLKNLKE